MRKRCFCALFALASIALLASRPTRAQTPHIIPHPEIQMGDLHTIEKHTWHISGKVTDLQGKPLRAASVRVDIGYGAKFIRDLTTDVQGEFKTVYNLDASTLTSLSVNLTVEREGFHPGCEFVDFGNSDKTWEIVVAMRPDIGSLSELPMEALLHLLGPKYRSWAESDAGLSSARKDLVRGDQLFLDDHDPGKAIPILKRVTKRDPDCGACLDLLGLAMLQAGSWTGAGQEFVAADKLASGNEAKADSLLIVSELEDEKGEYNKAAGFLMQAKDLAPHDAFILQELGRTLVIQQNWEAADSYLAQAVSAGAPKDALLLRSRALLEEGDPESANEAMKTYLGGVDLKNFPLPVRSLEAQIDARLAMRGYAKVDSVVNEPLPSLVAAIPDLKGLEPASSQAELSGILQKTGEGVRTFFGAFPNTSSVEQIREERLAKDGKPKDVLNERFQYLLLTRPEKWGLGLEEFRTDSHGDRTAPVGLGSGLMVTSGFASASLVFHPEYQSGAAFRYLGRQTVNGRECYVIAFAQDPKKAQMVERFNTSDSSVLVLFQGLAWIDTGNYEIIRLRTDLLTPQTKIRLQRQTTEITYDPVQFKQVASAFWLPSEVAVTLQWAGKTYRNTHRYSGFRLFNTDTQEKMGQPNLPTGPEDEQHPQQP